MKLFRSFLLILVIVGSFVYSAHIYLRGPCDTPIRYKIGAFDTRFNISQKDFISALELAEGVWEKSVGKELFVFDPESDFPIHLIYDERQGIADKNKKIESSINTVTESAESVKSNIDSMKVRFTQAKIAYESEVSRLNLRQDAYVKGVDFWNTKGGAPQKEYEALAKESQDLKVLFDSLDKKRADLNAMAIELNRLVSVYNGLIKNINSDIAVINRSADKEFEQGEYISDEEGPRINIYEFSDREMLVRVLSHELGHALGIDHNDNPESIMYYLNAGEGNLPSSEDVRDLRKVCRLKESL